MQRLDFCWLARERERIMLLSNFIFAVHLTVNLKDQITIGVGSDKSRFAL